jgi:Protein of unknown function (DUF2281)
MTIDAEIAQTLEQMPAPLKQEILHYAKYLIENYNQTRPLAGISKSAEDTSPPVKRRSGILKGTFVLPLPNNFDEPLEDFQDYMA